MAHEDGLASDISSGPCMVVVQFARMPLERVFHPQKPATTHPNVEIRRLRVLAELSCGPQSGCIPQTGTFSPRPMQLDGVFHDSYCG